MTCLRCEVIVEGTNIEILVDLAVSAFTTFRHGSCVKIKNEDVVEGKSACSRLGEIVDPERMARAGPWKYQFGLIYSNIVRGMAWQESVCSDASWAMVID